MDNAGSTSGSPASNITTPLASIPTSVLEWYRENGLKLPDTPAIPQASLRLQTNYVYDAIGMSQSPHSSTVNSPVVALQPGPSITPWNYDTSSPSTSRPSQDPSLARSALSRPSLSRPSSSSQQAPPPSTLPDADVLSRVDAALAEVLHPYKTQIAQLEEERDRLASQLRAHSSADPGSSQQHLETERQELASERARMRALLDSAVQQALASVTKSQRLGIELDNTRNALSAQRVELDSCRTELQATQNEVRTMQAALSAASNINNNMRANFMEAAKLARSEIAKTRTERDAAQREIVSQQAELSLARANLANTTSQREAIAHSERNLAIRELNTLRTELGTTRAQHGETQRDLAVTRAQRDTTKQELQGARDEVNQLRSELAAARAEKEEMQRSVLPAVREMYAERAGILAGADMLKRQLNEARAEIDRMRSELDGVKGERDGLVIERDNLRRETARLQEGPVSVKREGEDELGCELADTRRERDAVKGELDALRNMYAAVQDDLTSTRGELDRVHAELDGIQHQCVQMTTVLDSSVKQEAQDESTGSIPRAVVDGHSVAADASTATASLAPADPGPSAATATRNSPSLATTTIQHPVVAAIIGGYAHSANFTSATIERADIERLAHEFSVLYHAVVGARDSTALAQESLLRVEGELLAARETMTNLQTELLTARGEIAALQKVRGELQASNVELGEALRRAEVDSKERASRAGSNASGGVKQPAERDEEVARAWSEVAKWKEALAKAHTLHVRLAAEVRELRSTRTSDAPTCLAGYPSHCLAAVVAIDIADIWPSLFPAHDIDSSQLLSLPLVRRWRTGCFRTKMGYNPDISAFDISTTVMASAAFSSEAITIASTHASPFIRAHPTVAACCELVTYIFPNYRIVVYAIRTRHRTYINRVLRKQLASSKRGYMQCASWSQEGQRRRPACRREAKEIREPKQRRTCQ
ncbi:hypothetical protein K525DRAFT_214157 [Schizophyllum commune Loenen D]|nr:hypothetical protein K525DRAFT_214157 [Schizophyllum commune Loenen D]